MSRTDFEAAYIERYGHRPRGWNDDFQVYQDAHANGAWFGWQAREVVMPERQEPDDEWHYVMRERSHGWNACLDEFARLNKGAGSHD